MNILFISTFFSKENCDSCMCTDLVKALTEKGHRLTVLTTENCRNKSAIRTEKVDGADVYWIKTGKLYDGALFKRGMARLSLGRKILKTAKRYLQQQTYDLIFYESPPVTISRVLIHFKKIYHAPLYVFVKEIFPQSALDLGLMTEKFIFHHLRKAERHLYAIADWIGCTSKGAKQYLAAVNRQIDKDKIEVFPITKSFAAPPAVKKKDSFRKKYKIPKNAVVFFFGGKTGKRQDAKFICKVLALLSDLENVYFVFLKKGSKIKYIAEKLKTNKNVIFTEECSRKDCQKIANESDVGIVTLDNRFTVPFFPERTLIYMENALPVLAATDPKTDLRNLLNTVNCGLWASSNDMFTVCNNIKLLAENPELRAQMGKNGYLYARAHFDIASSAEALARKFMSEG